MSVNHDGLDRAQLLLCLVLDLKMAEAAAEILLAKAYGEPGKWREYGTIKVRKEIQVDRFSVRG